MADSFRRTRLGIILPIDATVGLGATAAPRYSNSILIQWLFAIGLVFTSSAFNFQFAHDETRGFVGSGVLQTVTALTGAVGLLLIVTSRSTLRLTLRCWPILAMVALAFVSVLWSHNPQATLRRSVTFLSTVLFALAMVGRLSPTQCIRLLLRVMVLLCGLSIVWVMIFSETAVHQLTDLGQTQHAGHWRGVFSHKQGLGLFAGLTAGLLLFYGSVAFRSPLTRIAGIVVGIVCLFGSGSATGLATMLVTVTLLFFFYRVATSMDRGLRKSTLNLVLFGISCGYFLWSYGLLDRVPTLLGRSSD